MTWVTDLFKETTTYWDEPLRDGTGGYIWGPPFPILGKWEETNQLVYDPSGAHVVATSVVWVSIRPVTGGYLEQGVHSGEPESSSRQIISTDIIRSIPDPSVYYYKAYLR